ncbi:hypothetical protein Lfu02_35730 [Longispora fulva]|uniref:Putative membrane protein YqhA n=1 Tax=Longispora fulva TaxID=619741 RepID=A0A8J7GYI2_9ACTN|nr:hypothetical protein [Longispora fulva]MBG6141644.1 putative membrane protein YqhA [Longispora fulva]GIG59201.1 hypothetical protein Lfu02_35730 [Longispora fulva]
MTRPAVPPGHARTRWLLLAAILAACAALVAWAVLAGVPEAVLHGWHAMWADIRTGS